MNIFESIKKEHDRHRTLAKKVDEAHAQGDTKERDRLWSALKEDVDAHADAEDQTLYAELIERPNTQETARHSVAEHKELDDLMAKVEDASSKDEWKKHFDAFTDRLHHHMAEEEEDVFTEARKFLTDDRAKVLANRFEDRKANELAN